MVNNKQSHIDKLRSLTEQQDSKAIRTYLEGLPKNIKGRVFEDYLSLIFEHNGWLVKQTGKRGDAGADLLLYLQGNSEPDFIIQAKNWNKPLNDNDVSSELNKFEKKSIKKYNCKQYQLFSINGYTKSALKYSNYNIKLRDWSDIADLIGKYKKTIPKAPSLELFSHNQRAFNSIKEMYGYSNRVCVSHATGTGKSYLIASVLQSHQDRKTIIVAPTNIILNELKGKFFYLMKNAKLMTYSKVANIKKADAGLIILDEFHRAGAVKWGAGVKRIMDANHGSIVFGTSATPYRYFEGRDMSDEIFEGNVASDLALPRAIAEQILPSPKYVYGIYDLNEESERVIRDIDNAQKLTKEQKNDYKALLNSHKVDFERSGGMPVILKKHVKSSDRKFIIFCDDTEHLEMMELDVQKWFRKAFPGVGTERYIVHSKEPGTDATLEKFKKVSDKKFHLLFSIDMLNEGLHVDGVNGVIMLRRTASPRIFYQQIGRCIASGGYDAPIIFDFVNNFNSIMATDFLSDVTEAVKSEQERRERDGLSRIDIPVDIIDETKDIEDVFFSIESKIGEWLPFEEARDYVRSLSLGSFKEWISYTQTGNKPPYLPSNPQYTYNKKGWTSWGNFLGTGDIYQGKRDFLEFQKARNFVHTLKLKSMDEWRRYCHDEKPYNIPSAPWAFYKKDGYIDIKDWLGVIRDLTYSQAKVIVSKLGLISSREWWEFYESEKLKSKSIVERIPHYPHSSYKDNGWVSWMEFLGTNRKTTIDKAVYIDFKSARIFARKLGLESSTSWYKYCEGELHAFKQKPINIPKYPNSIYKNDGWISWYDWLDNKIIWRDYRAAREYVHKLNLKKIKDWKLYCKGKYKNLEEKPPDIPVTPETVYKNAGWENWSDWLGNNKVSIKRGIFWDFKKARSFARKLKLENWREWREYCSGNRSSLPTRPPNIPVAPNQAYKNSGWKNIVDWLGSDKILYHEIKYLEYDDAKAFVKKLGLKTWLDWKKYCDGEIIGLPNKPDNIPKKVEQYYRDKGWVNISEFLGTENPSPQLKKFKSFNGARSFARSLGLQSINQWNKYKDNQFTNLPTFPVDMPKNPSNKYKGVWVSWPDFLGYEPKQKKK